ncbi:MAG: DUF6427 family protein [Bacteroidota bacterium]
MLIGIFRSNKPIVLIYLPFVAAALWIFSFISPASLISQTNDVQSTMPLYKLFIWLLGESKIIANISGILILIIQSIILNNIIIKNQILSRSNYLPALLYLVLMSCFPSLLTLHPELFANFFLIIALGRLLTIYRQENIFQYVFDAGFYIGIASLFYFPVIILCPFVWISLIILRAFAWREWIIPLIGLIVPYLFVIVYYFWFDMLDSLWYESIVLPIVNKSYKIVINKSFYLLFGILFIIIFLSLRNFSVSLRINTVRVRQLLTVLIWFFIFSLLSVLIAPSYSINSFALIAIPLSVYVTNYLLSLQGSWRPEAVFLVLIGTIVFVQVVNL